MIAQQPLDPTQTPAALSAEDVLKLTKKELLDLVTNEVDLDVDAEKVRMFLEARKGNLYWKGDHYHALTLQGNQVNYASIGTPKTPSLGADDGDDSEIFATTINNYRGLGKKFIAVVGNKPPSVKAVADNPEDEESERNAREADVAIRVLRAQWDEQRLHRRLALGLWKSNTMFGYVRYIADGDRYGYTEVPQFGLDEQEIQPAGYECQTCGQRTPAPDPNLDGLPPGGMGPQGTEGLEQEPSSVLPTSGGNSNPICSCGSELGPETFRTAVSSQVPVPNGTEQYPKGKVVHSLYDVLSVTVPTEATGIDDCPWLRLEYEEHRGRLVSLYGKQNPELVEKIRKWTGQQNDSASQGTGVIARQERDSPNSFHYQKKNLITYSRYWLTPAMYWLIADDEMRQIIGSRFPDGIRVTKVLDEIVEIDGEKLVDVWECCQPDASDTIHADGLGKDYIPIQDLINDGVNIGKETLTRQIPQAIADPAVINLDLMGGKNFRPAEIIPAKPNVGSRLGDSIFPLPKAEMNDQLTPFLDAMQVRGENITGILPAIYGGEGPSQTAHEAEMKRNQALQQLNIPWDEIRGYWARIYQKGVKQLAKYGTQIEMAPGDAKMGFPADKIDVANLSMEGWHTEAEEAFPMTYGQRRDQLNLDMQGGPELLQMLGWTHPANQSAIQELRGFPGFVNPGADLHEYLKIRVRELLKGAPIQQPDPNTGQIQTVPSVQPDPFIESDHNSAAEIIRWWCYSPAGRNAQRTNPQGFENVKAYGLAHQNMIQPPQEQTKESMTLTVKAETLPPDAQAQALSKFGIQADPQEFAQMQQDQLEVKAATDIAKAKIQAQAVIATGGPKGPNVDGGSKGKSSPPPSRQSGGGGLQPAPDPGPDGPGGGAGPMPMQGLQ
jgi:hypothetical protein